MGRSRTRSPSPGYSASKRSRYGAPSSSSTSYAAAGPPSSSSSRRDDYGHHEDRRDRDPYRERDSRDGRSDRRERDRDYDRDRRRDDHHGYSSSRRRDEDHREPASSSSSSYRRYDGDEPPRSSQLPPSSSSRHRTRSRSRDRAHYPYRAPSPPPAPKGPTAEELAEAEKQRKREKLALWKAEQAAKKAAGSPSTPIGAGEASPAPPAPASPASSSARPSAPAASSGFSLAAKTPAANGLARGLPSKSTPLSLRPLAGAPKPSRLGGAGLALDDGPTSVRKLEKLGDLPSVDMSAPADGAGVDDDEEHEELEKEWVASVGGGRRGDEGLAQAMDVDGPSSRPDTPAAPATAAVQNDEDEEEEEDPLEAYMRSVNTVKSKVDAEDRSRTAGSAPKARKLGLDDDDEHASGDDDDDDGEDKGDAPLTAEDIMASVSPPCSSSAQPLADPVCPFQDGGQAQPSQGPRACRPLQGRVRALPQGLLYAALRGQPDDRGGGRAHAARDGRHQDPRRRLPAAGQAVGRFWPAGRLSRDHQAARLRRADGDPGSGNPGHHVGPRCDRCRKDWIRQDDRLPSTFAPAHQRPAATSVGRGPDGGRYDADARARPPDRPRS
jgi:hypothetical protein